jgi:molybdenum cofactor cytidylyltransferase
LSQGTKSLQNQFVVGIYIFGYFSMLLSHALRLSRSGISDSHSSLAFVGAGGKSTALFKLAGELTQSVLTTTTHLGVWQSAGVDQHIIISDLSRLVDYLSNLGPGSTLITGSLINDRFTGLDAKAYTWLHEICEQKGIPLLIEADGARRKPLKAPLENEPVIPGFVNMVVDVAGMSGLGKPLRQETVHNPDVFASISGLTLGDNITADALVRVLTNVAGGLKNIPAGSRRVALLNQADTNGLQAQAKGITEILLRDFDSVLISSLEQGKVHAVHEPVAAIILAAGEGKRFGPTKQLHNWHGKPFIHHVIETALAAGLSQVVVVTGANAEIVEEVVQQFPVTIHRNTNWRDGQSTSIRTGLEALSTKICAAIFLLTDQPQVTPAVLRSLVERHSIDLSPIVAPFVQGQRANPVLFDRITFTDLESLSGDVGGRFLFSKYPVTYLPWHDEGLLVDVDVPDDLEKLG